MSDFLRILENEIQIFALSFLVLIYIIRLVWFFRYHSQKERTFPAGSINTGIATSMMNVVMPWSMESVRKKPGFYIQSAIFHIGVVIAISATFIIPYWPHIFRIKPIVIVFQLLIGLAWAVGLMRLYRRLTNPSIRLISTVDDYFSLIMMIFFFTAGFFSIPNQYAISEYPLILFFGITAFFLIYVPFSKIGHYLYYPITRYFLGKTMGHRGILYNKSKNN